MYGTRLVVRIDRRSAFVTMGERERGACFTKCFAGLQRSAVQDMAATAMQLCLLRTLDRVWL